MHTRDEAPLAESTWMYSRRSVLVTRSSKTMGWALYGQMRNEFVNTGQPLGTYAAMLEVQFMRSPASSEHGAVGVRHPHAAPLFSVNSLHFFELAPAATEIRRRPPSSRDASFCRSTQAKPSPTWSS